MLRRARARLTPASADNGPDGLALFVRRVYVASNERYAVSPLRLSLTGMNTFRYIVALVVLISLPPGLLLWLCIHPFAGFWRKLGPVWTYTLLGVPMIGVMVVIFLMRRSLLAIDFGTSYLLIALAVVSLVGSMIISKKRRRHLTFGILSGLPELSKKQYPGTLLTEGIYATIRHPRYMEVFLAVLAYAFTANYLGPYILALVSVPAIYLIVVLEEQELKKRFGEAYEEYGRRVPRVIPRTIRSDPDPAR